MQVVSKAVEILDTYEGRDTQVPSPRRLSRLLVPPPAQRQPASSVFALPWMALRDPVATARNCDGRPLAAFETRAHAAVRVRQGAPRLCYSARP